MAPTKAIAVKRAIDRIIKGPVDDADLRLAEKGVNDERIWAMILDQYVELRPEDHVRKDLTHPNGGIQELRRRLWTLSRTKMHPIASRKGEQCEPVHGVCQLLWRRMCVNLCLPASLETAYVQGMEAFGVLDKLGDVRTGVLANDSRAQLSLPTAASLSAAQMTRSVAVVQLKRQIGTLRDALNRETARKIQDTVGPAVKQLEVAIDAIHQSLFKIPLPPIHPRDQAAGGISSDVSISKKRRLSHMPEPSQAKIDHQVKKAKVDEHVQKEGHESGPGQSKLPTAVGPSIVASASAQAMATEEPVHLDYEDMTEEDLRFINGFYDPRPRRPHLRKQRPNIVVDPPESDDDDGSDRATVGPLHG